jgi:hypothetical protein
MSVEIHDKKLAWAVDQLKRLTTGRFFGEATFILRNGEIEFLHKNEKIKPPDRTATG